MTMATCINSIGLVLDIIGAILLWKYGLPPSLSREGHVAIIQEQDDEAEAEKAKWYDLLGNVGMGLLLAGFVLQLASNFL